MTRKSLTFRHHSDKQAIARRLVKTPSAFASAQVLQEFCNATRRRLKSDWSAIRIAITELQSKLLIHTNTASTLRDALRIAERYGFSFYDSLFPSTIRSSSPPRLKPAVPRFTPKIYSTGKSLTEN